MIILYLNLISKLNKAVILYAFFLSYGNLNCPVEICESKLWRDHANADAK